MMKNHPKKKKTSEIPNKSINAKINKSKDIKDTKSILLTDIVVCFPS
jgi:hypothetical protein